MWWIIGIWVTWSVVLLARHEHPINAVLLPPLYAAGLMVKLVAALLAGLCGAAIVYSIIDRR